MKLKIVSDGTFEGTRVETQEGHVIDGVKAVSFTILDSGVPEAMLFVDPICCEIEVNTEWQECGMQSVDESAYDRVVEALLGRLALLEGGK